MSIAETTMITEPSKTGENKYAQLYPPNMMIIGLAPAGGWVVFVSIIHAIARLTPNAIDQEVAPNE